MEFKTAVEGRLGVALPVTAVFDFPTVSALAGYIHARLAPAPGVSCSPEDSTGVRAHFGANDHRPSVHTVVVSTAGRASSGLIDGALSSEGIRRVPLGRWVADESSLDGSDLIVFGGFLDDAELFDGGLFGVHSTEAILMDPQQRLLLHFSWDALSGSGIDLASLAGLGVYVGISGCEYAILSMRHLRAINAFLATGSAVSVAAGRLSFTYGAQVCVTGS